LGSRLPQASLSPVFFPAGAKPPPKKTTRGWPPAGVAANVNLPRARRGHQVDQIDPLGPDDPREFTVVDEETFWVEF